LAELNIDYSLTLALACILTVKYIFFDSDVVPISSSSNKPTEQPANTPGTTLLAPSLLVTTYIIIWFYSLLRMSILYILLAVEQKVEPVKVASKDAMAAKFSLWDSSDSDEDSQNMSAQHIDTQTDPVFNLEPLKAPPSSIAPRSLDACLAVFKSDVSSIARTYLRLSSLCDS
jgi:hypothetical protein